MSYIMEKLQTNHNCIVDNANLVYSMLCGYWACYIVKEIYTRIESDKQYIKITNNILR
jgi:hypothetical protein